MEMKERTSLAGLREELGKHDKLYLLLYREGSEQSICALTNLKGIMPAYSYLKLFRCNVAVTRDIHPEYSLSIVPALLEFRQEELQNVYKGCHDAAYLRSHKVRFREIDVSRNEAAVREMVSRSGQQGVPQTVIDGQVVIGFDRERINKLLQIPSVQQIINQKQKV